MHITCFISVLSINEDIQMILFLQFHTSHVGSLEHLLLIYIQYYVHIFNYFARFTQNWKLPNCLSAQLDSVQFSLCCKQS